MGTAYSKYFAKPCFMKNRKQRFSYEKSQATVFTWKIANHDFHMKNCKQRFSEFLKAASAWKKRNENVLSLFFLLNRVLRKGILKTWSKNMNPLIHKLFRWNRVSWKIAKNSFQNFCRSHLVKKIKKRFWFMFFISGDHVVSICVTLLAIQLTELSFIALSTSKSLNAISRKYPNLSLTWTAF